MKRFFIIITMLLASISFSSCIKQLDIPQKRVLDLDSYYENAGPEEAEALIAAVHRSWYKDVTQPRATLFLDALSDDHLPGGGAVSDMAENIRETYWFKYSPSFRNVSTQYQDLYRIIFYCNLILEKIPQTTDATINRVKSEAQFFRALAMFEALRWWGTPPLVTKIAGNTPEERYPSNGDPKEIINWCLETMQIAADALPALSAKGTQATFGARVSKHAVLAYMGKMCVWYGTRYNDAEILAKAVAPLKAVIDSGLYELISDMSILDRPAGDFSTENIFEHNAADNDGFPSDQSYNIQLWGNWATSTWTLPAQFHNEGWGFSIPSGDFGDFLAAHEGGIDKPRFLCKIRTFDQVMAMEYPEGVKVGPSRPEHDNQGYYRWQGLLYKADKFDNTGNQLYSMTNLAFMRYSEVLLYYAEAKFLIDNDADGTGLKALNTVRTRAELAPLASMTYQDIKDERRAELWGRQERYFDLVRWGDAATALKDRGKVTFWTEYNEETKVLRKYSEPIEGNTGWDDKYVLLPFPQTQLDANPNLKQNPGW